jgi:undecaprenyl-diphosphatase
VAGGLLALGACTRVAARGIGPAERRVFERFNGGPAWVSFVLWLPMQLGSLWGPFVVAGVSVRRGRDRRESVGAVVAGVLSWQLAKAVKARVGRGRPADLLDGVAQMPGTPGEGLGFVSGHSAVAAASFAVVSPRLTKAERAAAAAMVAVIGSARMQVSAHLPLDVVGGAALGYSIGWGWNLVAGIPIEPTGSVRVPRSMPETHQAGSG